MFQYAAGRAVSLLRDVPLRLDTSSFKDYGLHQGFELHRIFSCAGDIATEQEIRQCHGWYVPASLRATLARRSLAPLRPKGVVVEPHFRHWQGINDVRADSYLRGYWQSEKYFDQVGAQIRQDFSFKIALNGANQAMADRIGATNAVSLHIRRGDYASNPNNAGVYRLCSPAYYQAAIAHIAQHVPDPHFFIFSDDMAWARAHLNMDFPHVFVDHNAGSDSFNDMRLMSLCKHHIIANSSFSWWGAWLNPRPQKIVVAPQQWFANGTDSRDLLPSNWEQM